MEAALDSTPADGPLARAGLLVEHRGTPVLLGLGGRGRVAAAAHGRPGLDRELVLAAVQATATDGGRVAAGLTGGDRLQLRRHWGRLGLGLASLLALGLATLPAGL